MNDDLAPFLICRLPGESEVKRFAFTCVDTDSSKLIFDGAMVSPWPGVGLRKKMEVCQHSTTCDEYVDCLSKLTLKLNATDGKTVICRQKCGDYFNFDVDSAADRYFASFPEMFCFLFYHPLTGYWMGASPELLLQVESDNVANTRSLAGTRKSGCSAPWSDKNMDEHRFVTDDILQQINSLGEHVSAEALDSYNFVYGSIEHLCTPIVIRNKFGNMPADDIISAIHPTPAVCGYPRGNAMSDIAEYEWYSRNCYGGLITVGGLTYVILRCVHFDDKHWAVYTGSGITADSDPMDEWLETEAKAEPLVSLINQYSE